LAGSQEDVGSRKSSESDKEKGLFLREGKEIHHYS